MMCFDDGLHVLCFIRKGIVRHSCRKCLLDSVMYYRG